MPRTVAPTVVPAGAGTDAPSRDGVSISARRLAAVDKLGHGLERRSDARLVVLARAGSEPAYEEILRRYRHQLHSYCAQLLGPSRAEDAVQQAFMQAYIALRRGGQREIALRPWLYRISHNCAVDILRKKGHDHDQLDPEYDGVAQPPTLLERKQDLQQLVARLRALPESQRRALTLRELEGRSYTEIAARLGHTTAGVRQLIFRARTALRNGVAALFPFGVLRERLAQHVAWLNNAHQAAAATAGADPASAGVAAVGAAFVAGLGGLGLLTGGVVATHDHANANRPASVIAGSPSSVGVFAGMSANMLGSARAGGAGRLGVAPVPGSQAGATVQPGEPFATTAPAGFVPAVAGPGTAAPGAVDLPAASEPSSGSSGPSVVPSPGQPGQPNQGGTDPPERPVVSGVVDPKRPAGGSQVAAPQPSAKPASTPNSSVAKPSPAKPITPAAKPDTSSKPAVPKPSVPAKQSVPTKQPVPIKQSVPIKQPVPTKQSTPTSQSVSKSTELPPKSSPIGSSKGGSVGSSIPTAPKANSPAPARGQGPSRESGQARRPVSGR